MTATLEIINNFSIETQGRVVTGKQGAYTANADTSFDVSIDGKCHKAIGELATASGRTLWDEDDDSPADFDYFHFWADQDCYLQLIGQTSQVSIPIKAKVPHTQYGDQLLAAANTTPLAAEPTLEDIDSIRIWNQSGNTLNYDLSVFD